MAENDNTSFNSTMFSDDVIARSSAQRFLFLIKDEIERSVEDGIDSEFENPNSTVGKFIGDTKLTLDDINKNVTAIRKDTTSLVSSMIRIEKLIKNVTAAGGGGGASDFFNKKKSLGKKVADGFAAAAPFLVAGSIGSYLVYKGDQKTDVAAMVGGNLVQKTFGNLATDVAKTGVALTTKSSVGITNTRLVAFLKGIEKSAKYSRYAGTIALIILNALEPIMAWLNDQPDAVVRREIVGAIANVLGTIVGIKIGAIGGAAIGSLFAGLGAAPGLVVGALLGGVLGYFSGEGLEFLAEKLYETIVEGGDMERVISEHIEKNQNSKKTFKSPMMGKLTISGTQMTAGKADKSSVFAPMSSTETDMPSMLLGDEESYDPITGKSEITNQKIMKSPTTVTRIPAKIEEETSPSAVIIVPSNQALQSQIQTQQTPSFFEERVGGIEDGTGKYLTDQRDQMPSMMGNRFRGRTATGSSGYGAGTYGGMSGDISIVPGLSKKDELLWNELNAGKTIVSSSTLGKFSQEQLDALNIEKTTTYGGERHMPATTYRQNISDTEIDKKVMAGDGYKKAVLAGMASSEGGNDYGAINYMAGGGRTNDFTKHPFLGKKGYTASGRYQILASNYEKYGKQLGITSFDSESQDKVAWHMAADVYKRGTGGRDLETDAKNPANLENIFKVLGNDWHGLRGDAAIKKALTWAKKENDKASMTPEAFAKLSHEAQVKSRTEAKQRILDEKKTTFAQTAFGVNGFDATGGSGGHVLQNQGKLAATRKGALQPTLVKDMENIATKNGVNFEVSSGGQRMEGAPGATGAHNHDQGFAADFSIFKTMPDGKKIQLDIRNPEDHAVLAQITKDFAHLGHSVGMGYNYMSGNKMHAGSGPGGPLRAWGDGHTRSGMPDFLASAFDEGVALKESGSPFGEYSPKEAIAPMIASLPPAGPTIDAAYVDSRIKAATGELTKQIETIKASTPVVSPTGQIEERTSGPNIERFGGKQDTKPSSFRENNAKQKLPDWAFNPTIYTPLPPTVE